MHLSIHSSKMRSEKTLEFSLPLSLLSQIILEIMNVFQYFLFKLVLVLGGQTFLLYVSINLFLVNLNDVFHSLQTIVKSECLGGSSMLVSEEEGVQDYPFTINLLFFPFSNKCTCYFDIGLQQTKNILPLFFSNTLKL